MKKDNLKQINVDNEVFNRIKKHKKTIYIMKDEQSEFQKKQNITVINNENNKKLNKKIVKIYPQNNLSELKAILKRKEKYIYPTDIKSNDKITAIEFKYNKKIFRKILLSIICIGLLLFATSFINEFITDLKVNKFRDNMSKIEREKVSYVFIEINPSLVLTIKDNKVSDVACLNDDCLKIYNDINIKGKSINESIDNLYNLSKEKGYDTSNGVKVKTTDNIEIKNEDYISVEYIDNTTKNELLSNVKNNEEIKNINNDDYYSNLWKELKKDSDYGKVYECNMNNEELECYIKDNMFVLNEFDYSITDLPFIIKKQNHVIRVLNKFGLKTEVDILKAGLIEDLSIYVNEIKFSCNIDGYCFPSPHIFDEFTDTSNLNNWGEFSLYNSEVGLNLLNPNNILNNLLFEEEYEMFDSYYEYEATILVNKICDINISNCKNYKYTYCDLKRINETKDSYQTERINCKNIDSQTYQNYYDEYVTKKRGWGCITLDEFGIENESVCTLEEYYEENINNPTITAYVRCKFDKVDYKNCTSISLTNDEFKEIEYSYPHEDKKVYKDINGIPKVCELDPNTLKFKCVNEYDY